MPCPRLRRSALSLLVGAFLTFVSACDESPHPTPGGGTPGLGDAEGAPSGTAYALPAGITLETRPRGYGYVDDPDCPDLGTAPVYGAGGVVTLCLVFRNTTQTPIAIELPPGLIFVSESVTVQNGLLTERVTITVPAQSTADAIVAAFCTNLKREVPDASSLYSIGPVTDDPGLRELLGLLVGVDLPGTDLEATQQQLEALTLVQTAVWEITDDGGLTAETRARVEAL